MTSEQSDKAKHGYTVLVFDNKTSPVFGIHFISLKLSSFHVCIARQIYGYGQRHASDIKGHDRAIHVQHTLPFKVFGSLRVRCPYFKRNAQFFSMKRTFN